MSSIRISLNGEHQQTISLEGHPGVLSCIVNYMNRRPQVDKDECVEDHYHMSSGGIDNTTGDYVDWPRLELAIGDHLEFEILAASEASPPASRRPHDGDAAEYSKKDYIRSMAKKFGWEVIEHEEPYGIPQSEQGGVDQPATAPESKSEGSEKPKPESKVRPQ
jgi:hypothetical protein